MCAWLTTTASMARGSKGKQQLRSMDSSRRPWYKPHSSNSRCSLTSSRYMEPVVVRVAPRKWIRMTEGCWEKRRAQALDGSPAVSASRHGSIAAEAGVPRGSMQCGVGRSRDDRQKACFLVRFAHSAFAETTRSDQEPD